MLTYTSGSNSRYLSAVRECDLKPLSHIAKVMIGRSENDLSQHEKAHLINEYYELIGMRNLGLIKLAIV